MFGGFCGFSDEFFGEFCGLFDEFFGEFCGLSDEFFGEFCGLSDEFFGVPVCLFFFKRLSIGVGLVDWEEAVDVE